MLIQYVTRGPKHWRLSFVGSLDTESAAQARTALAAVPDDAECLVLDLEELDYTSLAGLRELLIARRRFPDGVMRLENVKLCVMEALACTGFLDYFPVMALPAPRGAEEKREVRSGGAFRDFLRDKCREAADRTAVVSAAGEHSWAEIDASTHVITLHGPSTGYAGKVVLFG